LKGGAKSGRLKRKFSQVEGKLNLQKILKPVPILKNRTPRKKVVVMKDEDEESDKTRKN
jgi:hypothetical protein